MNNLATNNTVDFIVTDSGDAYISQRKTEQLLGLSNGTLRKHISRHHSEVNTSEGLSDKVLQSVTTYFAYKSSAKTVKAEQFAEVLMDAGARAYIYHEAGYGVNVEKKPMTPAELFMQQAQFMLNQEMINSETKAALSVMEAKLEAVEISHANGVPTGYLSKSEAYHLYARGLSRDIFDEVLRINKVKTKNYMHTTEYGLIPSFGWKDDCIELIIEEFIDNSVQATPVFCENPALEEGRRFRFKIEENVY